MKKAISLAFAAVALPAMCDTVAWWRFGDLGPEGGNAGGKIITCGTPEEIVKNNSSHTARFLAPYLKS